MARWNCGAIGLTAVATTSLALNGTVMGGLTTVDFSLDDNSIALGNGQIINNNDEFFSLFTVTSSGNNAGLVIFDSTTGVNSSDPDLWVNSGNLLTFQQNGDEGTTGDFFNNPNDTAQGGTVTFNFVNAVEMLSIDFADINGNGQEVTLTLTDSFGHVIEYFVPSEWTGDPSTDPVPGIETLDLQNLNPQPGFMSSAIVTQNTGVDITNIVMLEAAFAGSGGLDNLTFVVPAPSGLAVFLGAGLRRRRRRRG